MQIFPVTAGEVPLMFESSWRQSTRGNLKQSWSRKDFSKKISCARGKILHLRL